MEVQLSSEQEAQLSQMAALAGRGVEELAREAVDRYLLREVGLDSAVRAGQESAERGEFLTAAEVWANVERELQA
jgi:predicted transcriptional regulator